MTITRLAGLLPFFFLATACGGGGGSAADASMSTSGVCGVRLGPAVIGSRADTHVLFSMTDGTTMSVETTDADGEASREDCGPNTVVSVNGVNNDGFASLVLQPGEFANFGAHTPYVIGAAANVSVQMSSTNIPAGTNSYFAGVAGGDGNAGNPGDTVLAEASPQFSFGRDATSIIHAYAVTQGTIGTASLGMGLVGFDATTGVTLTEDAVYSLDGWDPVGTVTFSVPGVPADAPAGLPRNFASRSVSHLTGGIQVWETRTNTDDVSVAMPTPTITEEYRSSVVLEGGVERERYRMLGCDAVTTTDLVFDLSAALPVVVDPSLDTSIAKVRPRWTPIESAADAAYIKVTVFNDRPVAWSAYLPPSASDFRFPDVPAELLEESWPDLVRSEIGERSISYVKLTSSDWAGFLEDVDYETDFCYGIPHGERHIESTSDFTPR